MCDINFRGLWQSVSTAKKLTCYDLGFLDRTVSDAMIKGMDHVEICNYSRDNLAITWAQEQGMTAEIETRPTVYLDNGTYSPRDTPQILREGGRYLIISWAHWTK